MMRHRPLPTTVRCRHPAGMSMIELLVAMAIGLILTAGIVQIFVGSKETYRFQEALSRIQETGRYATQRVSRDLRMTGYQGCAGDAMTVTDHRSSPNQSFSEQFGEGIRGFAVGANGQPPDKPGIKEVSPAPDTEGLRLSVMQPTDVEFEDSDPPALKLKDGIREEFEKCDAVFLEDRDCGFGKMFISGSSKNAANMNTNGTGSCPTGNENMNPGKLDEPWPNIEGARAMKARRFIYFVKENDNGEPALWLWQGDGGGSGESFELVEGVEDLHVEYGIDDGGEKDAVDRYETVGAVEDDEWSDVVAVRVSFLVRSRAENVTDEAQTVSFPPGTEYTASDRRLRQTFTTTVAFRNRIP